MTTLITTSKIRVKKQLRREPDYNYGILHTDKSYAEFSRFIESRIAKVKTDRAYANKLLHATGMYDENGRLKEEFK